MSAVAETSTTALEAYTPVIVGLGAVVLGLLANGALEWWKSFLTNRSDVRTIRHAVLFELVDIENCAKNTLDSFDDEAASGYVGVNISSFLVAFDREKIGKLSKDEVIAIAAVTSQMTGVLAAAQVKEDNNRSFRDVHFFNVSNNQLRDDLRVFSELYWKSAKDARKVVESNLGQ